MPRYCAAIYCKNRRGRNHKDRKLSFYPFPLHDKDRLEKWLKNMKRDSWVPSKYQFLCSDHFTPDSLDIRWGIRYLKQTAIPTIFSLPEDSEGKDPLKKKPQKKKSEEKEVCLQASQEGSFASKVTSKNLDRGVPPKHAESLHSFALVTPPAPKAGSIQNSIVTLNLVGQDTAKPESTSETAVNQDTDLGSFHTPFENLSSTTVTLTTSDSEDAQQSLETQELLEKNPNHHANPTLTNSMEIKSQENPSLLSPINQTVEELNTDKESVSASFVPTEDSKPAINCFTPAGKEITEMEDTDMEDSFCRNLDYGTEVLQLEHSYCRQDVNKENLWQKVSKLHSKVTLLELQEQQTLGRLKSLEALIRQLTQESWLSEENVKVIENHFTTYEVTMT